MKNGIWHPADFEGKNAGEEKTKEKTAVAIAYEPGERAPKILATGKGYLADKIIEKAKEEDVPLYQDNQLANTLSRLEIGDMIPPELYEVVAEILVFVDDMDKLRSWAWTKRPPPKMPARQSISSVSRRWKRSVSAPLRRMLSLARLSSDPRSIPRS